MLTLPGTIFAQHFSKRHNNDWLVVFYALVGKIAKYNYNNDGIEYCEAFLFACFLEIPSLHTLVFRFAAVRIEFYAISNIKGWLMWLLWHRNVTIMAQKCEYGTGMWLWNRNVAMEQECDYYGTGMWVWHRNVSIAQECDYCGTGTWLWNRNVTIMAQECD